MSGEVVITGRLGTPDLTRFKNLIPAARTRAIRATETDLHVLNSLAVPIDTGRLQSSFVVLATPGQIAMKWSAIKPGTSFDYAKIQDEGGPTRGTGFIRGKHYSTFMLRKAKELLIKHLIREIGALQP